MNRHPNKEIRAAIEEMIKAGWRIEKREGHSWGRAFCPGGSAGYRPPMSIWSTPRVPERHARQLRRAIDQCPTAACRPMREGDHEMPTYSFEVHFTGPAGGDVLTDALYEAGWDDATVSFNADTGGVGHAAFDRDAPSAIEAIVSAIEQGRDAGLDVTGVRDDMVSLGEIAERVGRTLAAVDHWVRGRRGPGGFPAPRVPRARAALWSWAEVAEWLVAGGLAEIPPEDIETARICRAVDMVLKASRQVPAEAWHRIITVASTAA
jgi:hypothetical protein